MPKTSRTTAPTVADHGPVVDRSADLEGYSVNFVSFAIDIDGAPLLKSLPDDRCACPRWGYVFKGSASFTFADRRRDLRGRRRLLRASGPHARPLADSEILMFSPSEELAVTAAVMLRNMQAMMAAPGA